MNALVNRMEAFMAPATGPTLNGKPVQLEREAPVPVVLPQALAEYGEHIFAKTKFVPLYRQETMEIAVPSFFGSRKEVKEVVTQRTKHELFQAFPEAWNEVQTQFAALIDLFGMIVRANIILANINDGLARTLAETFVEKMRAQFPRPVSQIKPVLLALKSPEEIHRDMTADLKAGVNMLPLGLQIGLEALLRNEFCGAVKFYDPERTAAEFFFYRTLISDRVLTERKTAQVAVQKAALGATFNGNMVTRSTNVTTTTNTKTDSDIERTVSKELHREELMDAKLHPWPAMDVPMPERVRALLDAVPETIRPITNVLSGQEIFRQIIRTDLGSETRTETKNDVHVEHRVEENTYRWDPAVLIGSFCITGWHENEA